MKLFAIGAFALASLVASTAVAQTAGPANPGPVIPGVCVYFNQRLLAQSTAGQAVQARMEQLSRDVQGELTPYATSIQSEIQTLQTSGASLSEAERNSRSQVLGCTGLRPTGRTMWGSASRSSTGLARRRET